MSQSPNQHHPQKVSVTKTLEVTSGPLPAPAILEKYEVIVPGAAERIFKLLESQTHHRIALEKKVINSETRNSTLGIVAAFIISFLFFVLAGYAIYTGSPIAGAIIGGINLGSIVWVFIYGSKTRREERLEKARLEHRPQ